MCPGQIAYVDLGANGNNTGASWDDAYQQLQDALKVPSTCGLEAIHVAQGTYYPDWNGATHTGDRAMSFVLLDDVDVLGGFPTTGATNPDPSLKPATILSGDLGHDDTAEFGQRADNSYHVVTASGIGAATVVDGFRIRGGQADGTGADRFGAGMHASASTTGLTLRHTDFTDNWARAGGAGLYVTGSILMAEDLEFDGNYAGNGAGIYITEDASLDLCRSSFTTNTGRGFGGAVHNRGDFELEDALFEGNVAGLQGGSAGGAGIVTTAGGSLWLNRATFTRNEARDDNGSTARGAAIYVLQDSSYAIVANSAFERNLADNGAVLFVREGTVDLVNISAQANQASDSGGFAHVSDGAGSPVLNVYNSILWENTAPTSPEVHIESPGAVAGGVNMMSGASGPCVLGTCVAGSPDFGGNNGFPELGIGSIAINSGQDGHYLNHPALGHSKVWPGKDADIRGHHRINGRIDLGAWEYEAPALPTNRQGVEVPETTLLRGNYPNPFNPVTSVVFELARSSTVRLEVFDSLGRLVSVLADGPLPAGSHQRTFNASSLASGVYLYRMTVDGGAVVETRSMLLLK